MNDIVQIFHIDPSKFVFPFVSAIYLPFNIWKYRRAEQKKEVASQLYYSQLWKSNGTLVASLPYADSQPHSAHAGVYSVFLCAGIWYLCSATPLRFLAERKVAKLKTP